MPSLKDLRNRIASVQATQKITKAMQMVAAAKLRRAQEAAEAARPYAERMETVLANLSSALQGSRRCAAAAGRDRVATMCTCLSSRLPNAGCVAGSIPRFRGCARNHAQKLMAQGKTVKIICVGKKGHDALKRQFEKQIIEVVDLKSHETGWLRQCAGYRPQGDRLVRSR